jgi:hypothetical protein
MCNDATWMEMSLLKAMTSDPSSGEPYVMWGDTPYAHIMVPVGTD